MANFTEKAIVETLNELLKTHTIDRITVKDLTQACGISRNTFYYHYHDIYEVLTRSFKEETEVLLKAHEADESWEKLFVEGLRFLYDNKTAIDHIYRSVDSDSLVRFLNEVVYNYVHSVIKDENSNGRYDEKTISTAADFYKNALIGAVLGWIENDMKESPEDLAHLYDSVFNGTIEGLLASIEKAI